MSTSSSDIPLDIRIQRMLAESDKFVAEQRKLMAESAKLEAERSKYRLDSWLAPWLAIVGLIGGVITVLHAAGLIR